MRKVVRTHAVEWGRQSTPGGRGQPEYTWRKGVASITQWIGVVRIHMVEGVARIYLVEWGHHNTHGGRGCQNTPSGRGSPEYTQWIGVARIHLVDGSNQNAPGGRGNQSTPGENVISKIHLVERVHRWKTAVSVTFRNVLFVEPDTTCKNVISWLYIHYLISTHKYRIVSCRVANGLKETQVVAGDFIVISPNMLPASCCFSGIRLA